MRLIVADYAGHPFQSQLSRELARRGWTVRHLFAEGVGGPKGLLVRSQWDAENLEFKALGGKTQNKASALSRVRVALAFGAALDAEMRGFRPDIVLATNVPPEGLLRARLGHSRVAWVWWVQDLFGLAAREFLSPRSPVVGAMASAFYQRVEAGLAESADGLVVIAESFRQHLPTGAARRAVTIRNWAPLDELPVTDRSNGWALKHSLASTFNFVYSGTLGMKHAPEMLVELARSFRRDVDVRVIVVSEGGGVRVVERLARQHNLRNVITLPFQPYEVVPEVLGTADVLVALLDDQVGSVCVPSKILSYLCASRPILGAIPARNLATEIIHDAGAGWVVPAGDCEGFVLAAKRMFRDASARRSMGRSGRRFAEERFHIASIGDRFEAVLKHVLQKG